MRWCWVLLLAWMLCGSQSAQAVETVSLTGAACWSRNLAPTATIVASDERKGCEASHTADGALPLHRWEPAPGAWQCKQQPAVSLAYSWKQPVEVGQIVFFGLRNRWFERDCAGEFRLSTPDNPELAVGHLVATTEAQCITLDAPVRTAQLTLEFKGLAGAGEILLFPAPLSVAELSGLETAGLAEQSQSRALAEKLKRGELGFGELTLIERHKIDPSHIYTYHAEGLHPGGGLYRYQLQSGELTRLVDSPHGIILDQEISYDGKTILFSWKSKADVPFQIFTIGVDGGNLTQLTHDVSNNFNACWLPDGGIAFLSDRKPAYAYCMTTTVPVLYRMESDGQDVRRLSANYLNDFTPSVLSDGRILYSRWEYVDRPAIPIQSLWAIRPDGTMLQGVFGNRVLSPATFMEAKEIPGTGKLLCVMTGHNGPCRGAIGIVDPTGDTNAQSGIRNITGDVVVAPIDDARLGNAMHGPYESPYPLDAKHYLVSRLGTVLLRDYDETEIVQVLPRGKGTLGWYSPRPIAARPLPPTFPALPRQDDVQTATVVMSDVYNGLQPQVDRGTIKQLAVVQEIEKPKRALSQYRTFGFQFPTVSCGATYAPKKIWGYATVEADGSAHFQVPSGVPLYFMALDEHGRAIQRMRTFTHFMPGETQSCTGCHANRNQAAPVTMNPLAGRRPAEELIEPEFGVRGFSYHDIVQPVFDNHCLACHDHDDPPNGLDLSGDFTDFFCVSYELLARMDTPAENPLRGGAPFEEFKNPYTKWIPTYNGSESNILLVEPNTWGSPRSKLADVILSGHFNENGDARFSLTPGEQRRIFHWIDLNVPYYGTSVASDYTRSGCRRILPSRLEPVLAEVAGRRCASCHEKIPRTFYTRISHPERNSFLLAPLSRLAGGLEACGQPIFASTADPDYQKILKTFDEVEAAKTNARRADMF